jgi:hypothetical protein
MAILGKKATSLSYAAINSFSITGKKQKSSLLLSSLVKMVLKSLNWQLKRSFSLLIPCFQAVLKNVHE